MQDEKIDLLGVQLDLAQQFLVSGFERDLDLYDDVTNATVKAGELFFEQDGRWFMRAASIPGHIAIKAMAVDVEGLYLETSPLNLEAVRSLIVEKMLPFSAKEQDGSLAFIDLTTNNALITIGAPTRPKDGEIELEERCLWAIPTAGMSRVRVEAAIKLADILYTAETYVVEEVAEEIGPVTSRSSVKRVTIRLQFEFQQRLMMEQRPLLSLKAELETAPAFTGAQVQTIELRQIMALNFRLARMGEGELQDFFAKYVAEHGIEAALNVAVFTLAGKVKRAMPPGTTWREARRVARKLIRHPIAS